MLPCKVHNVGFYSVDPRAIYVMTVQKQSNKLAVARSDASIEIWNLADLPFIERTIPPSLDNFSIEGLCWYNNRLFSVGLHGYLVEYNLYQLGVKEKWVVTGEAATCLDIYTQKSQVAVGTEQGYINIFQIHDGSVTFEKFLDKQEGRIICIKFSGDGEYLVTGSINAIRIWNVSSGHAIHKMQMSRVESKKDTIVWCLEVLSDFTIFSGDSRGVLTLWDGKLGSYVQNYQSHKADITALCLSDKQNKVYCAGADPLITTYEKVKVGQTYKWVKSIQRRIHDHDVRALVYLNTRLYSAGIDSYLACSYFPPKTLIKYAPLMQNPCVQLASKARLVLLRYPRHVEIWSLAAIEQTDDKYIGGVQLKSNPKKLVLIQRKGTNWLGETEEEAVFASTISSDGQWIFVGTCSGFRLYQLEISKDKPKLSKMDDLDDSNSVCVQATFNDKHQQLIVCLAKGSIVLYDLEDGSPFISQIINHDDKLIEDTVTLLAVSSCGKYLAAGDPKGNIVIWSREADGYAFRAKLPRVVSSPTALAINSASACLVVVCADSKIVEYSLKTRKITARTGVLDKYLPSTWKSRTHPIRSITFDPRKPDVIVLSDDNALTIIKDNVFNNKTVENTPSKTKKVATVHDASNIAVDIRCIQKYKHLVHFEYLSGAELVAVETNPLSILKKLPPAFAQTTYGTK